MADDLAREIRIVAHLGLRVRLDRLVSAAVKYQQALKSLSDKKATVEETREVLEEAESLASLLPPDLGLVDAARARYEAAQGALPFAQRMLTSATEELFDVTVKSKVV